MMGRLNRNQHSAFSRARNEQFRHSDRCDARAEFADALSFAVVRMAACNIERKLITTFSKVQECLNYGGN